MMKKLTKPILISYGALAVPLAALGLPLTVYLPPFYEGPIGLSVGTVGIIFMVARFWDIFTDPLMGALVDRYPSKWGRRKHWIVIGIPILMLASWYVFIPSEGEKTAIYLAKILRALLNSCGSLCFFFPDPRRPKLRVSKSQFLVSFLDFGYMAFLIRFRWLGMVFTKCNYRYVNKN